MASKLNPKSLMTVMTMTVMTTLMEVDKKDGLTIRDSIGRLQKAVYFPRIR